MILTFSVAEQDAFAFTKQYYQESPNYKRMSRRFRWVLPAFFVLGFAAATWGRNIPPVALTVPLIIFIVGWVAIAPYYFDWSVRRNLKKHLREPAYEKSYGRYELEIDDRGLLSSGPIGRAEYRWDAVTRATLTDDYLFIFLAGAAGFPIKTSEVGLREAQSAYDVVRQKIDNARPSPGF